MAAWIPLLTALASVVGQLLKMRPDERDKTIARLTFVLGAIKKGRADDLKSIDEARQRAESDPDYGRVRPVPPGDD